MNGTTYYTLISRARNLTCRNKVTFFTNIFLENLGISTYAE